MAFRIINKRTRVLLLFLGIVVIVGIFVNESYDVRNLSFATLGKIISDLNLFRATITTQLEPPEYSEMGGIEEKLEELFAEVPVISEPETQEEVIAPIIEPEQTPEEGKEVVIISSETELALMKIKVRVDEISEETQRIDKEVKKLKALVEIEKKVKKITDKVQNLSQEVKKSG